MSCRKMVIKIIHIIKGWYYKIFNIHEKLAIKRIAVCKQCDSCMHIDMLGDVCAECGCVLSAKARVLDEQCELNKWNKL